MCTVENVTNQIDILHKLSLALNRAIMATPSGDYRNQLADMQIHTVDRIESLTGYVVSHRSSGHGKAGS